MTTDRRDEITALLLETEQAHGRYETTELKGVYDTDWARWYAAYAVEHGMAELIGSPVTADQLAETLTTAFAAFEVHSPQPGETWATYAAGRIADR
jgi:hypothetical protein